MTEKWSKIVKRAAVLFFAAGLWAVLFNFVSPRGIPLVGFWPTGKDLDKLEKPLSYQPTDPPLVNVLDVSTLYQKPDVIFLDARPPADFEKGHIPGAINIPFEEVDLDEFWPKVADRVPKDKHVVTYCGGADCEASLHLARFLKDKGYPNLHIFFGGWKHWTDSKMPVEQEGGASRSGAPPEAGPKAG